MSASITLIILLSITNIYHIENHAIYVSVVEIEKRETLDDTVLRFKIFADDLEDAIHNHSGTRVDLLKGDCKNAQNLIENYLDDHFKVIINNKSITRKFQGCELNDISLWLEFAMETPTEWKEVKLSADYLMELFPTQNNVVSISYNDSKRLFRLTNNKTSETVRF